VSVRRFTPRLVLLDRDGTLNRKPAEGDYVTSSEHLELLPGAAAAVHRLNKAGILVAVVTNQRGVALGRLTAADLDDVHAALRAGLLAAGARVDRIYHCPHHDGTCGCRKPQPGLLERASRDFQIPLAESAMVGDADSDVEAGRRAGAVTVQLMSGADESAADFTAPDLAGAVDLLLPE
jgi:D-glycero-D-manno-heptose 1,7-bisphosphate phosphatase